MPFESTLVLVPTQSF